MIINSIKKHNSGSEGNVQFLFMSLNLVCLVFFILMNSVSKISKQKQKNIVESLTNSFHKKYSENGYYIDDKDILSKNKKDFVQKFKLFYGEEANLSIDGNFISFEVDNNEVTIDKLINFFKQTVNLISNYNFLLPYHENSGEDITKIHRKISQTGLDKKALIGIRDSKNIYVEIEF